MISTYIIKSPESDAEIHRMWRLNHAVFAEEYPQHPASADGCLIDKFHGKNIYRIAWDGKNVLGMISAHWRPPFSAVAKFGGTVERHIVDDGIAVAWHGAAGYFGHFRASAFLPSCRF